jgi:hypothetical protein
MITAILRFHPSQGTKVTHWPHIRSDSFSDDAKASSQN